MFSEVFHSGDQKISHLFFKNNIWLQNQEHTYINNLKSSHPFPLDLHWLRDLGFALVITDKWGNMVQCSLTEGSDPQARKGWSPTGLGWHTLLPLSWEPIATAASQLLPHNLSDKCSASLLPSLSSRYLTLRLTLNGSFGHSFILYLLFSWVGSRTRTYSSGTRTPWRYHQNLNVSTLRQYVTCPQNWTSNPVLCCFFLFVMGWYGPNLFPLGSALTYWLTVTKRKEQNGCDFWD